MGKLLGSDLVNLKKKESETHQLLVSGAYRRNIEVYPKAGEKPALFRQYIEGQVGQQRQSMTQHQKHRRNLLRNVSTPFLSTQEGTSQNPQSAKVGVSRLDFKVFEIQSEQHDPVF